MIKQNRGIAWIAIAGGLGLLSILALGLSITPAWAHGAAELSVSPTVVAPGGTVTVSADGVEAGEVFTITLEGVTYQATFGTTTVTGDSFQQDFTIPDDAPAGSYQVRATSAEGEQIAAELTVTATAETQAQAAATPTAKAMQLDRQKTPLQLAAIIAGLLVSAGLGFALVRVKG